MSRKNRFSIRNPHVLRKGATRNALSVEMRFKELVEQKKREIKNMMQDLSGKIITVSGIIETQRAVRFNINIAGRSTTMAFIIWTDERSKDNDFTNSQFAKFVLRLNEDFEERALRYLDGIQRGCTTEYLYSLALEELKRERIIHSFHKTGRMEDKFQKKDFAISILKDGLKHEIYLQVKSSEEALMAVKDELLKEGIAGSYYSFTGDLQKDVDAIKKKIVEIIEEYKKGNIIVV